MLSLWGIGYQSASKKTFLTIKKKNSSRDNAWDKEGKKIQKSIQKFLE